MTPAKSAGQLCVESAEVENTAPIDAPERMDLGVIIVKHSGVKDAGKAISRFREDACLRAQAARKALLDGGDWETTHAEYSDEQGGEQGIQTNIHQGNLDPNVAAAAFSLKVDEITQVVSGESGFQIVWRKN